MLQGTPPTAIIAVRPPLYASVLPVPVACFVGALIADITYAQSLSVTWQIFAIWLITAGLVMAGLAVLAGVIDLVDRRRPAGARPAWIGLLGLLLAGALALVNAFVHSRDAYTSVVPTGLILSACTVLVLLLTAIDWGRPRVAATTDGVLVHRRRGAWAMVGAALVVFLGGIGAVFGLAGPKDTNVDVAQQLGANPVLPAPHQYLLPPMHVAPVARWANGQTPAAAPGLRVEMLANGFAHPRFVYALPNGDVLVVESSGPTAPISRPKELIMGLVQSYAGAKAQGGNRITLLRAAKDGAPAVRTVFLDHLTSPFGVALVNHELYVADTDALLRFPYEDGQTSIAAPATRLVELPAGPIDHHWTKTLLASADGNTLYVGVGSNSNITENGLGAELDRACIWAIDRATGAHRIFATGIRNPTGLGWEPESGKLWAIANERDELGPNLVPDYLTSVQEGGFYGWPYSYYGQHVDPRVQPQRPDLVARALVPDYALGSHMAPLGLAFATANTPEAFRGGAFVGEHGSWDRDPLSGYKVVFVPFAGGRPSGKPRDVLTGFLSPDGHAHGRPVGLAIDGTGALLVADDLGDTVWRVTADHPPS